MSLLKKVIEKRILRIVIVALAFLLFSIQFISAADPGHGAGVIGSADFESGNYSFPDSLIVNYSAFFATGGGR